MDSVKAGIKRAGGKWGWMLAAGLVLILIGIFATTNPVATGLAVGVILASTFAIGGCVSLIAAFKDTGWQAKTVDVLFGLFALIASFICLVNPFGSAVSLIWVGGVFFIANGVVEIVSALRRGPNRVMLGILGVIDILLGIYIAFYVGPLSALVVLAFFVGVGFIVRGVMLSVLAFRVRGLAKAVTA